MDIEETFYRQKISSCGLAVSRRGQSESPTPIMIDIDIMRDLAKIFLP